MAIIKCPECNHEVSDKAQACPNCGCPINQHELNAGQTETRKVVSEPKWVEQYRTKAKKRNTYIVVSWIVLTLLGILFTLLLRFDLEVINYGFDYTYEVKIVWIPFTVLAWCLLFFDLVIGILIIVVAKVHVEYHNEHIIVLYDKIGTPALIIDNIPCKFNLVKEHLSYQELFYRFSDGETMTITCDGKNAFFNYSLNSNIQNQTIVNNIYQTNAKPKVNTERSDMEKTLIKNAKIDALASIDPTNTEKSKEQIEIVKELDNLG